MNKMIGTMLLVGLLLLSSCGTSEPTAMPEPTATPLPPTATSIPAPGPDSVALKLAEVVNARDLDGALALYADDAVVNSGGPEPFVGKAEIQGWLEGMIADNFQIEIEILEVSGDKVVEKDTMTMDSMSAMGIASLQGISEITVREGKITALNFTFAAESLAALQSATAAAITLDDLVGAWRWDGGAGIGLAEFRYYQDSTYEMIRYIVDSETLWDAGAIEIEGNLLTFVSSEDTRYCEAGQRGSYEMALGEDGQLKMELVEDACMRRKPPIEEPIFWSRALAAASLAEPQSATAAAITLEELVGAWRWDGGAGIGLAEFRYYRDSTYEMIRYIVDSETLWDAGAIEIEGNLLTFVSSEDTRYCEAGQRGSYEMSLGEDGQLKMELVEDACMRRKPPIEEPIFWSRAIAAASPAEPQSATAAAITLDDLVGAWRWDGGAGIGLAEFRYYQDSTYEMIRYIVDSETLWDAGAIEIEGNLLTFVSSEDTRYCEAGQRGSYEMSLGEDGQLKMELVEDACMRRKPPIEEPILWSRYSS